MKSVLHKSVFFSLVLILLANDLMAGGYQIVPQPNQIVYLEGKYRLDFDFQFVCSKELLAEAQIIKDWLIDDFVMNPVLRSERDKKRKGGILIRIDDKVLPDKKEGYILEVNDDGIVISSSTKAGIIYGAQSLRQIIKKENGHFSVQKGIITDYPNFSWRAFMLDEARNFKGKKVVKNLLDEMVLLKLNVFHWHLVDDQGWRIEIKKYPRLTQIGGYRDSTELEHFQSKIFDGKPQSGFYTQDEIREIVKYAEERNIQIIPEIEMPGHASASIAAYPWLGTSGKKIKVPGYFGVMYDVYDVSNPDVRKFLQDVLEEVFELFPSPIIHIGGDEVRYNQWNESKKMSDFMKKNKLNSPAELQVYFTNEMSNWISQKGKKMMGWNEITGETLHEYQSGGETEVENKLAHGTIVHFWKGDTSLINKTLNKGYDIVNSYHIYTYLDYDYNRIPLKKSYFFNPVPSGLSIEKEKQVLGLGCQMWGEFIPNVKSMNKKIFPRIAAYSEVGWTNPENKDYDRFLASLQYYLNRWKKNGIEYGPVQ